MNTLVFTIDDFTPSLNRQLGKHWAKHRRMKKDWFWLVKAALGEVRFFEQPRWKRVTITVERHYKFHPIRDHDNLQGSLKPVLDALVKAGVLFDDDEKYIGQPEVNQVKCEKGAKPVTIIKVRPQEDGTCT